MLVEQSSCRYDGHSKRKMIRAQVETAGGRPQDGAAGTVQQELVTACYMLCEGKRQVMVCCRNAAPAGCSVLKQQCALRMLGAMLVNLALCKCSLDMRVGLIGYWV